MTEPKTIRFKSTIENFNKEQSGIKPNTVRFTDDWDDKRWKEYVEAEYVVIQSKDDATKKFKRRIIDKTKHKNVIIISWSDDIPRSEVEKLRERIMEFDISNRIKLLIKYDFDKLLKEGKK